LRRHVTYSSASLVAGCFLFFASSVDPRLRNGNRRARWQPVLNHALEVSPFKSDQPPYLYPRTLGVYIPRVGRRRRARLPMVNRRVDGARFAQTIGFSLPKFDAPGSVDEQSAARYCLPAKQRSRSWECSAVKWSATANPNTAAPKRLSPRTRV